MNITYALCALTLVGAVTGSEAVAKPRDVAELSSKQLSMNDHASTATPQTRGKTVVVQASRGSWTKFRWVLTSKGNQTFRVTFKALRPGASVECRVRYWPTRQGREIEYVNSGEEVRPASNLLGNYIEVSFSASVSTRVRCVVEPVRGGAVRTALLAGPCGGESLDSPPSAGCKGCSDQDKDVITAHIVPVFASSAVHAIQKAESVVRRWSNAKKSHTPNGGTISGHDGLGMYRVRVQCRERSRRGRR